MIPSRRHHIYNKTTCSFGAEKSKQSQTMYLSMSETLQWPIRILKRKGKSIANDDPVKE